MFSKGPALCADLSSWSLSLIICDQPLPPISIKPGMPSWLQSPLSRILAAVFAFLATPIGASARPINSSIGLNAAKRFEPLGDSGNTYVCPTFGPEDIQPITLEGNNVHDGDGIESTICEYSLGEVCVSPGNPQPIGRATSSDSSFTPSFKQILAVPIQQC